MTVAAHFASARSELVVVERPSVPMYEGGRLASTKPGKTHQFHEHRYKAEGQASIDFLRQRAKAPDGPEIWELEASDVPEEAALLAEMATADIRRVRQILRAEEAGPARQRILETCRSVLARAGVAERSPAQPGKVRHEIVSA